MMCMLSFRYTYAEKITRRMMDGAHGMTVPRLAHRWVRYLNAHLGQLETPNGDHLVSVQGSCKFMDFWPPATDDVYRPHF